MPLLVKWKALAKEFAAIRSRASANAQQSPPEDWCRILDQLSEAGMTMCKSAFTYVEGQLDGVVRGIIDILELVDGHANPDLSKVAANLSSLSARITNIHVPSVDTLCLDVFGASCVQDYADTQREVELVRGYLCEAVEWMQVADGMNDRHEIPIPGGESPLLKCLCGAVWREHASIDGKLCAAVLSKLFLRMSWPPVYTSKPILHHRCGPVVPPTSSVIGYHPSPGCGCVYLSAPLGQNESPGIW